MDLVEFTYDCYGKKMEVKNPKYHDANGQLLLIEKVKQNSLYTKKNILDSYLVLGKNGVGKTTFFKRLHRFGNNRDSNKKFLVKDALFYDDGKFIKKENMPKFNSILIDRTNKNLSASILGNDEISIPFSQKNLFDFIEDDMTKYNKNKMLRYDNDKKIYIKIYEDDFFDDMYNFNALLEEDDKIDVISKLLLKVFTGLCILVHNIYDHEYDIFEKLNILFNDITVKLSSSTMCKDIESIFNLLHKEIKNLADYAVMQYPSVSVFDTKIIEPSMPELCELEKYFIDSYQILKDIKNIIKVDDNDVNNDFYILLGDILQNEINKSSFIKLLSLTCRGYNLFNLNIGTSAGEQSLIEVMALINTVLDRIDIHADIYTKKSDSYYLLADGNKKYITYNLLLDEIEQNMHPEWCRLLYTKIEEVINKSNTKNNFKFYIYLTTHSPYIISDFTNDHIINLDDNGNKNNFKTFGANIHDILCEGMFLKSPMGKYASKMINKVHTALLNAKNKDDAIEKSGLETEEKLIYFIDCIGEILIRKQLQSLYEGLCKDDRNTIKISKELLDNASSKDEVIELLKKDYNIELK